MQRAGPFAEFRVWVEGLGFRKGLGFRLEGLES